MVRMSGWRALPWLILAGVGLVVLAIALVWLALALTVLGLVVWLHTVALPRLTARTSVPIVVLEVLLLVALVAGGGVIDGLGGALGGGLIWFVGVYVPRTWRLRFRARMREVREIEAAQLARYSRYS